jgi:hypothetical protein
LTESICACCRLMRLSRNVSSLPAWRPMRNGVLLMETSRRTPFGSITTSLGARGIGYSFLSRDSKAQSRPGAAPLAPHMVGKLAPEVNSGSALPSIPQRRRLPSPILPCKIRRGCSQQPFSRSSRGFRFAAHAIQGSITPQKLRRPLGD